MSNRVQQRTVRVLFVCLGNICRSPMAEAVFRAKTQAEHIRKLGVAIEVESCGTGDWNVGQPPHVGTRKLLDAKQISYVGQRAKQLKVEQILAYDYIVAMDRFNVADLKAMGVPESRIELLTDYVPSKLGEDVPDPYYTGNFEYVYELIDEATDRLLDRIIGEVGAEGR